MMGTIKTEVAKFDDNLDLGPFMALTLMSTAILFSIAFILASIAMMVVEYPFYVMFYGIGMTMICSLAVFFTRL